MVTGEGLLPPPADIAEQAGEFVGRSWVGDRIAGWLTGGGPVLLITGEPGAGKTMVAAQAVAAARGERSLGALKPGFLKAAHFCRQSQTDSIDTVSVLERVSGQLAATVPGYAKELGHLASQGQTSITIGHIDQQVRHAQHSTVIAVQIRIENPDPRFAYHRLIREPMLRLREKRRLASDIAVLIDGLDETVEGATGLTFAVLLARELGQPVPGLRLCLTSRPGAAASRLGGWERIDLTTDQPAGVDDVHDYAGRRVSTLITGQEGRSLARDIARAAGGNFLYARAAIDDIARQGQSPSPSGCLPLPAGLRGVYAAYLDRELFLDDTAWEQRYRPVLGALAQSRGDGLSALHLERISGLPRPAVDDALRACAPYLHRTSDGTAFRPYHEAFREYLRAAGRHHIYPGPATQAIVTRLCAPWHGRWQDCNDTYVLRNLLAHLGDLVRLGDERSAALADQTLRTAVADPGYIDAAMRVAGAEKLIIDLDRVIEAMEQPPPAMTALRRVLARQAHVLRAWDPGAEPGLLLQQLHYEADICGEPDTAAAARDRLSQRQLPHLRIAWSAGEKTSPLLEHTIVIGTDARPLTVTRDGRRAVVGSGEGVTVVWDLATGRVERRLTGHAREITSLFASEDGAQIITASADGTVRIWRPGSDNGQVLADYGFPIPAMAVTPDGCHAAVADPRLGYPAKVYDTATGQLVSEFPADLRAGKMSVTRDGRRVLTGNGWGNVVRLWDIRTGRCEQVLDEQLGQVTSLAITPDSRRAITSHLWPGLGMRIWDLATGRMEHTLTEQADTAVMTPDGRSVITAGSHDSSARVWDLETAECTQILTGHLKPVYDIAVSHDSTRVATASGDDTARVWDIATGECLHVLAGHRSSVWHVTFTPDGNRAVTSSADGTARVWRLDKLPAASAQARQLSHVPPPADGETNPEFLTLTRIDAAIIGTNGTLGVTHAAKGHTAVWDLGTGTARHILTGPAEPGWTLALSPDARWLAVGGFQHDRLRIYDLGDGNCVRRLPVSGVMAAVFTPASQRLITGHNNGSARVWDMTTGADRQVASDHGERLWTLAISPDEQRLITGSDDGTARVWDLPTGTCLHILPGHGQYISAAAITPDGHRLVTGSSDGVCRIWEIETGSMVHTLTAHTDEIYHLALAGSRQQLITGSGDGTACVWDLETGALLHHLSGHSQGISAVAVSGDERRIVTASADATTRVWDLASGENTATLVTHHPVTCMAANPAVPGEFLLGTRQGTVLYAIQG